MRLLDWIQSTRIITLLSSGWVIGLSMIVCLAGAVRLLEHRLTIYFDSPFAMNDEGAFLSSFQFFLDKGWSDSLIQGASPLSNLFALLFYHFIDDPLLSLRLVSVAALFVMILAWWLYAALWLRVRQVYLWPLLAFLVTMALLRNHFFTAVADPLMALFISLGFIFLSMALEAENRKRLYFILAGLFCALALSVREMFVLYLPAFLLVALIPLIQSTDRQYRVGLALSLLVFVLTIALIHAPVLLDQGHISYLIKEPDNGLLWVQRTYLGVMEREHWGGGPPPWDAVAEYLRTYGDASLPKGQLAAILMDAEVTFRGPDLAV